MKLKGKMEVLVKTNRINAFLISRINMIIYCLRQFLDFGPNGNLRFLYKNEDKKITSCYLSGLIVNSGFFEINKKFEDLYRNTRFLFTRGDNDEPKNS